MFFSETRITVRYAETDQMGVVHHSNYPIWFEAGRTDFIKKVGISYSQIEEKGFLLPLIELRCIYKGAARYEDAIVIRTSIKELSYTRVSFKYEVYREDQADLVTCGETMHVWTTRELKPINIKKHFPELYDMMSSITDKKIK